MKDVAGRGALGALLVCAALAAPAQATVRQGAGSDPAGDSTTTLDIVEAAASADDATGKVAVAMRFAAAPSPAAYYAAIVGTRAADECAAPYVIFAGNPAGDILNYATNGGTTKRGQIAIDGNVVTLAATDAELTAPYDCLYAAVKTDSAVSAPLVDETSPIALAPVAPPQATPAPPAPTPAPTVTNTPPVPVPKAAKLTLAFGGAPSTIKRNKRMTLTLKIANDGSKTSPAVKVSFAKARGLSGLRSKRLPALKPAQKRTLKLKVRLTKAARKTTTLKVTVRAGKLKETSSVVLRIGKAKRQPQGSKSPIVGTFWWRTVTHVDYAWDNRALYFVDGGSVYSGFPKGGLPAACTTPPAEPDLEVDAREGCVPYTFDAKTGAVTIGDKAGTFKNGELIIDGVGYTPLFVPPAGKRYTINEFKHASFQGFCGLITGCSTTQKWLTLAPDGQFVLTSQSLTTIGDPGSGPYTAAGSYPPDQHGTYEVQANGRIVLSFADGSVRTETFAEDTKDGQPSPTGEGVFLGEDNFYPPTG
jgi:hypothetical protein